MPRTVSPRQKVNDGVYRFVHIPSGQAYHAVRRTVDTGSERTPHFSDTYLLRPVDSVTGKTGGAIDLEDLGHPRGLYKHPLIGLMHVPAIIERLHAGDAE